MNAAHEGELTPQGLVANFHELATLPEVVLRVANMVDDPNSSASDIGREIASDAALTGRLLRIANSPAFAHDGKIATVSRAIAVLGVRQVRDLTVGISAIRTFDGIANELVSMESFWRHNVLCATAAGHLAARRNAGRAESPFVAGLLHDIGQLVMFSRAPHRARQALLMSVDSADDLGLYLCERAVLGFDHGAVGVALAQKWKLPSSLQECIEFHHEPDRARRHPVEVATVHIANSIAVLAEINSTDPGDAPALSAAAWQAAKLNRSDLNEIVPADAAIGGRHAANARCAMSSDCSGVGMNLDTEMAEIAKVFFQESREGLDAMEAGLLGINADAGRDHIDAIFRAAHSIKGGAATFGFEEVARFTHDVETLLDEMRQGLRSITAQTIHVLLQSCDCLREMIATTETERPLDQSRIASSKSDLHQLLDEESLAAPSMPSAAGTSAPGEVGAAPRACGWHIVFEPVAELLRLRNEPTRMFRELERLGDFVAHADISRLPVLEELDPQLCYLAWEIDIAGDISKLALDEIFDWLDSRCRIEFTAVVNPSPVADVIALKTPIPKPGGAAAPKTNGEASSVRVATGKLDNIINLVGELLITQSMLSSFADGTVPTELDGLRQGLAQLARNTRELQESVMQIRMLPISFAFNRFPRIVHDLAGKLGKRVELKLTGEGTELDKTVLEKISDPLVHLVRNALDHGLETPERRVAAGKNEIGILELRAFHEGGNIIVEVRDDGAGLNRMRILQKARERALVSAEQELTDEQIDNLIFAPGFSTADQVSDVSGRGVGMDVVRRNINDLGGHVQIVSNEGTGSTIRIRLPLTLAILDGQLVRVGQEIYIVSLLAIVETIQVTRDRVNKLAGRTEVVRLRDEFLPVLRLYEHFGIEPDSKAAEDGLLVIVEAEGRRVAVLVDDLLAQQQVVIKSLEANFQPVPAIAGATILGDGTVALILDVPDLIRSVAEQHSGRAAGAA